MPEIPDLDAIVTYLRPRTVGTTIAWERATTNFCRHCQPGLMTETGRRIPLSGMG